MAVSEFELIARYFSDIGEVTPSPNNPVILAGGDDCALLEIPQGQQLALSIDTLNSGVHFPANAHPTDIAQRSIAVAVSDLAAMGAKPLAFTLSLCMPSVEDRWLQDFSVGLKSAAQHYGMTLIGGDTTKGPLSLAVQVHGILPSHQAIRRSGADVGDCVFVTGSLGDGAAALAFINGQLRVSAQQQAFLLSRFYQPEARVDVGESLRGTATAAIDVSDGLLADLAHILKASGVGAELYCADLPISATVRAACAAENALRYALNGGDDYELCFTASPDRREQITELAEMLDVAITEIGRIVMGDTIQCLDHKGQPLDVESQGYQHF